MIIFIVYLDETLPETKTSNSKPPPVETKAIQSKTAPTTNSKDPKHNDKPKAVEGSPVIVPLVSNITPPKSHVPKTNDPKQSSIPSTSNPPTLETKQVAKEKPVHNVCTNQKNQMNHGQPPKSVPTAQKLPALPKTSDAKHSANIRKNPKKS